MDEETRQLIERTKQRRERLKKIETDLTVRKRRPLTEDNSVNIEQPLEDESPKRQCLREEEHNIKPDTPAIRSVRSRRADITIISQTSNTEEEYVPVPVPRKSLSHEENHNPNPGNFKPERQSRFAKLAQTINSWDDDYSYHTISKANEGSLSSEQMRDTGSTLRSKSPAPTAPQSPISSRSKSPAPMAPGSASRSRSPAPLAPGSASQSRSPAPLAPGSASQSRSPAPLAPGSASQSRSPAPLAPGSASQSRSPAPLAPGSASTTKYSASVRSKSPAPTKIHNLNEIDDLEAVVSRMSQQANALPPKRIFKSTASCDPIKGVTGQIPINSKGLNESFSNGEVTDEEPTNKPVSERLAKWNKKVSETDTTSDSGPSSPMKLCPSSPTKPGVNQNLSSRLALLEKNLSASPSSAVKINKPVTPSKPTSTTAINKDSSVSCKSEPSAVNTVVMRVKENKNRRESFEPTRESVSKRMADWQKKVAAVENTKEKEPTAYPVNARMSAWEKVTSAGSAPSDKMIKPLGNVLPTGGRPPSTNAPSTSVSFVPKSPTANRKVEVSPIKCDSGAKATLSPAKASCAMKAIHQRLLESQNQNTTHSLAEKIRQERMAELKAIENRWQNGLLKEHCVTNSDVESVSNEPTTNCNSSSQNSGRPLSTGNQSGMPPPPPPPPPPLPPVSSDTYNMPATATVPPPPPPPPMTASVGPTSIFKLITSSQPSSIKNSNNPMTTKNVVKQVRFEDSFESSDDYSESAGNLYQSDDYSSENEAERTLEARQDLNSPEEEVDDTYSSSEENGGSLAARASTNMAARSYMDSESDDVSISAFVPEAVRQQCKLSLQTESCSNILALARKQQQQKILDDNNCSFDSMDDFAQPTCQDTTDDSEESTSEGLSVDDALDEALEMDTTTTDDDRAMETPTNQSSANKRGSHYLATCTDSCFDDESTSDDNVVMRNRSPLMYSISMYRSKRFSNNSTPVQKIIRNSRPVTTEEELESESCEEKPREDSRKAILHRIKELNNQISLEQTVILQTSNALNHCCTEGSTFNGSAQQVECHKLLLIACQKRRAYLTEIQRLKDTNQLDHLGHGTRGTLTVSDIRLPLKKDFVSKMTTVHDLNVFYYVILLRNGPQVFATQLMSTHDPMVRGSLDFPNMIKLNNITAKFEISLELYEMKLCKEKLKDKKKKTKKCKGIASSQVSSYPSGLSDIHTSSFSLTWSVVLTMKSIDKTSFTMERVPYESPLIGSIYLRMKCIMETNVSERGFLTMFEDVSGLGAWHRRWCVLNGNKLKFWKYPDDENRKDPIGYIDLKRCITEKVGLISRDVCARPNTFEMCTVRPLRPGEEDTLTTRKHTTMATIRHMLSADTKEERILWCNKVNQALDNIRAWQPDALRPIRMANQAI